MQCIWNSWNSYRTQKKERTFERLWSFWNDWFSGSTLISVTPANFDHFRVYPKLDNPPTPQKSSSRRVLEFFVNQPKVQVIPILKFSLQNYLWFHVPPSPTFNSPSPSGGISRWFMMRCTFGSTWWMARCQKRHRPCVFLFADFGVRRVPKMVEHVFFTRIFVGGVVPWI